MSTVLKPRPSRGQRQPGGQRLLTVADLAALPADLPSGTVKYKLDDGRLILIDPKRTTVTVYRPGKKVGKLRIGDVLTAEGVIPGLRVPVAEFV
jgi:hypothetical protein